MTNQNVNLGSRTTKGSYTGGRAGAGGMSGRRGRGSGSSSNRGRGRKRSSLGRGIQSGTPSLGGIRSGIKGGIPNINKAFRPGVKLGITTKFKLNDPYWTRRIGKARANGMKAQGALLRRYARNSIRYRKTIIQTPYGPQFRPSKSPKPPFSHTHDPIASIKNIQFDYSPISDTLIVGAVFLRRTHSTTVPSVHEHGKTVSVQRMVMLPPASGVVELRHPNRQRGSNRAWRRMKRQGHPRVRAYETKYAGRTRIMKKLPPKRVTFPPRPFMKPALSRARANGRLLTVFSKVFQRSLY